MALIHTGREGDLLRKRPEASTGRKLLRGERLRAVDRVDGEEVSFTVWTGLCSRVADPALEAGAVGYFWQVDVVVPVMKRVDVRGGGQRRRDDKQPVWRCLRGQG
jgi:hypothetical protein